jgi:pimeloyl-ACP methyl ester carboxylesterase
MNELTLLQWWPVIEFVCIAGVFGTAVFLVRKDVKARAKNPPPRPSTVGGWIWAVTLYVLRLVGFMLGLAFVITLVIMLERGMYAAIHDAVPTPSEVTIPDDLGFEVEEITFESEDGLTIAGWYVPSQNGATIILLHGYGGNRTGTIWYAQRLVPAGYGVLMYDERASGESEGEYRSYGWEDPRDVGGAIRFIEARTAEGRARIGIGGCSIGGQISLQGAAYHPEIEAVWADDPGTVRAQDIPASPNPLIFLISLGNYPLDWMFSLKLGIEAPPPMIEIIDDIAPRPIMLVASGRPHSILGGEDFVQSRYRDLAGDNAQMWVIPEAMHCDGPSLRPEEYAAKMVAFFDAAFGD